MNYVYLNHQRGLTLIEMMITVAILLALVGGATASFQTIVGTNRSVRAAKEFSSLVHIARSEAQRTACPTLLQVKQQAGQSGKTTSSIHVTVYLQRDTKFVSCVERFERMGMTGNGSQSMLMEKTLENTKSDGVTAFQFEGTSGMLKLATRADNAVIQLTSLKKTVKVLVNAAGQPTVIN